MVTPQFARLKALWISICAKRNISAELLRPPPVSYWLHRIPALILRISLEKEGS